MTDKEILEYSKQIVDKKTEIETSESAKPDLEDQIRSKFTEDSANRAKFIDSTLVIGAASKEFRNVFGVDAPHYEINTKCYYAIDSNNDEQYVIEDGDGDERVSFHDPMQNYVDTKTFTDCWQMIDAARFDSTSKIDHDGKPGNTIPVDRQPFFVDSKKAEKGSSIHQPICPPGYDKWAGAKIYDYICKNFDLTEPVLYKILSSPGQNTIPANFTLGPFDGDHQFSYNIDNEGKITKEKFQYNYDNDSRILACANNNNFRLTNAGCTPSTKDPITWYTTPVLVTSTKSNKSKRYFYKYRWTGTPFQNSRTPVASFRILDKKGKKINNGFVVLCINPKQLYNLPKEGTKPFGFVDIQYCVHLIYRENENMYDGDNYQKGHKFLWWSWSTTVKKKYSITFEPISYLSPAVKRRFADFVVQMENDVISYYGNMHDRKIKNDIPDWEKSLSFMTALRNAAQYYLDSRNYSWRSWFRRNNDAWNLFMTALRNRVAYDLYDGVSNFASGTYYNICDPVLYNDELYYCTKAGSGSFSTDRWAKIFSTADKVVSRNATVTFQQQSTYISAWENNWLPGWPRWLRRLFKRWSTPVYTTYDRIVVESITEIRNIEHNTEAKYTTGSNTYFGPSGGDLTRFFNSGNMTTRSYLVNYIMSEEDRTVLRNKGIISGNSILINGVYKPIDNTKIEVTYNQVTIEMPPYNTVKRAQHINAFLEANQNLYTNAFRTLSDRINKRTGTLRNLCVLLESTNINAQMLEQKKKNIANLFTFMNAYEITGGFGSNVITVKLAGWEPSASAISNLSRLSTVYLVSDLTQTVHEESFGNITVITDKFKEGTYVKTIITDIVDLISDVQYTYEAISGEDLSKTDQEIIDSKKYYVYDDQTSKYVLITTGVEVPEDRNLVLERTGISSGPIFNVTLQDKLPASYKGRNPILVKVY